jgi:outer membrane receptor protein involved in Fe transport
VGPFPEFRNVNLDKLRFQGFEVAADWNIAGGLFAGMNYTHLGSRDVVNPGNPVGESYADKLGLETRFASPNGRWMVAYQFRYQGPQKDIQLVASPVGTEVPSFSVHTARASARILETGRFSHAVSLVVNNIGNRLYAESANTSFFRPEPGRNVLVTWSTSF